MASLPIEARQVAVLIRRILLYYREGKSKPAAESGGRRLGAILHTGLIRQRVYFTRVCKTHMLEYTRLILLA